MTTIQHLTDPLARLVAIARTALTVTPWGELSTIDSDFGTHAMSYTATADSEYPEEGDYVDVGFVLPDDTYVVIESNIYGQLQAIRIYRDDLVGETRAAS